MILGVGELDSLDALPLGRNNGDLLGGADETPLPLPPGALDAGLDGAAVIWWLGGDSAEQPEIEGRGR